MEIYKEGISLGRKLKFFRLRSNCSQFNLEFSIKASPGSISRIENNLINPNKETILNISKFLNLSSEEIVYLFDINSINLSAQPIEIFYKTGKYKEIYKVINLRFEKLSYKEKIIYAKVCLELGEFQLVDQIIDSIEKKNLQNMFVELELLRADLSIHKRKLPKAKLILGNLIQNSNYIIPKRILGKANSFLGEIAILQEDIPAALIYFETALEYLNIVDDELDLIEVYLYLSFINLENLDLSKSEHYLNKVQNSLVKTENSYYLAWYYYRCAQLYFVQNKFSEARKFIDKSIYYNKESGTEVIDMHYNLDILGRINLAAEDLDNSYLNLSKALDLELKFRPDTYSSITKLFKYHIEASNSYINAINQQEEMLRFSQEGGRDKFTNYVISMTKYVYGDLKEQVEGEENLKKLAFESPYKLLKRAAKDSLRKKQIQPLI